MDHDQYIGGSEDYPGTPFKAHASLGLSYPKQGLIFFTCLSYEDAGEEVREKIERLCRKVGGSYEKALFERMTTGRSSISVAQKHFISVSTLYGLVRRFYQQWQEEEGKDDQHGTH